jgi:electron transport complex protein RnfB
MTTPKVSSQQIDTILPQTQCGLCGYGGCLPYARALADNQADINLCPPGGVATLKQLGNLLGKDATPYLDDMLLKTKPALVAVIREDECIGCTKCIQACPVDAIVGAAKLMHTIVTRDCTGCELCIAPCPVDCIDMISSSPAIDPQQKADQARKRFNARELRIKSLTASTKAEQTKADTTSDKKAFLAAALLRARLKK